MARIRIKIDANGNPTILDTCGLGTDCVNNPTLKDLEKRIGRTKEETRTLTDSYHEIPEVSVVQEIENG